MHTAFQNAVIVNIFSALELLFEIETLKTETTIAVAYSFKGPFPHMSNMYLEDGWIKTQLQLKKPWRPFCISSSHFLDPEPEKLIDNLPTGT